MSGLLTVDRDLSKRLTEAASARQSGILTAVRGKLKRLFCLDAGELIYAASNILEEQPSDILIQRDLLDPGDMAAARQAAAREGARLTRLLIDQDVVDAATMESLLDEHFRTLLFETLDWTDGQISFAAGRPNLGDEVTLRLPCTPLLLEYAGTRPAQIGLVRARIGPPNGRPQRVESVLESIPQSDRSDAMDYLVGASDGSASVGELIQAAPDQGDGTWRALYGLILCGAVSLEYGKVADSVPEVVTRTEIESRISKADEADYYAVLELNSSATQEQVREAYYFLARRYHPDRFRSTELDELMPRIESYFAHVTEAYNTLFDAKLRQEYDEQRASSSTKDADPKQDTKYLAQQNYVRAKSLIERGRFTDAAASLENAISLDGKEAKYPLALGRLLARNPRLRQRAEVVLLEAIRIDPAMVDPYLILGKLYGKTARPEDAARMFREVLRWEPGHLEATALLNALEKGADRGILGGLFKG